MPKPGRTEANLHVALAGEADANRRYLAYGIQAMAEGRADIAQLFFEAAGAETIHALMHLKTMGAIGTTRENLMTAATGEIQEIDVVLPRMIREADEDGRPDAAASFQLALDRERHHRDMFRHALATFDAAAPARGHAVGAAAVVSQTPRVTITPVAPTPRAETTAATVRRAEGRAHMSELETEPGRIERLASIREVVFGAQDGLVSTFAVVAGLAAAGVGPLVVLLGGAVSAMAGVLSMSIGTFLSSRAQRQLYERELERERREIRDHAGEEVAELIGALAARGMPRSDAAEVARRIARHPDLLLSALSIFELGLAPQRLGRPVRDALVMAVAFGASSIVPLLPFPFGRVLPALGLSALLTLGALFGVGVLKARVAGISALRSGLEVAALAAASGLISFGLGRLASLVLGVDIRG
ncbi:MAG TPA: VIT1/CCC1 transporter family protein [Methylomirabilota bacterium]|jgi:VIT1/CCC1 family predicted Fe2+/Mn2+ transporter/rubrerythrin|nr:VIT1/CCC1 transporter family protein [Methylomirabilota bacterium]